jgi:hypothetical protein
MSNYQKIFSLVYTGFFVLILGILIYAKTKSDDKNLIKKRLETVIPDSLVQIIITPKNPEWPINLTIDTIRIHDELIITQFTKLLNNMNEEYPGRGLCKTWEANIILDYKNNKDIKLEVVDSYKGICVFYTNTMGLPQYKCNGMKPILENVANFTQPLGKRR